MKKQFPLLSSFALTMGLTFSAASCSDTCLDPSNNNSNSGQIENPAQAEKHDALQRLISAVTDADSLPDNWNSDTFSIEPTIGVAASETNTFVRLVPTRSAEEADRQFRCMIGDAITGKATDSEWTKKGIGTLKFKVQNQADLYATIDVDVKQLPHLTQIRFVPASAIGNNGWLNKVKSTYYQFGDVIKQTINGNDTYWVCVRPCSVEGNLGRSHWCTFQLQPLKATDANYKEVNTYLTLPTKLCNNESDGQKMTHNLFNVLRVLANPDAYKGVTGIDDITTKEFAYDDARNISNLWKRNEIWDAIYSPNLQYVIGNSQCKVSAYYYGYNTVYFGKGNYRMYRLDMECNEKNAMFENATPTNPYVLKDVYTDYSVRGNTDFACENDEGKKGNYELKTVEVTLPDNQNKGHDLQLIVKYRTGAELENAWTNNDKDPTNSFVDRQTKNNITDVLVSKKLLDDNNAYATQHNAFFSIGDEVYLTDNFNGKQFCVKEANPSYDLTSKIECNKTYFVCSNKGKLVDGAIDEGTTISNQLAATLMYHCLVAYANAEGYKDLPYIGRASNNSYIDDSYVNYIDRLKSTLRFGTQKALDEGDKLEVLTTGKWDNDVTIKVKANINTTCYELTYNKNTKESTLSYSTYPDSKLNAIRVYAYEETHANKENYSKKNKLVPETERAKIKTNAVKYVNEFLQHCTFIK